SPAPPLVSDPPAPSIPGTRRVLGALALCAACLSRYEAWPAAALFAALTVRDAVGQSARRSVAEGAAALIALLAPAAWIVHGVYNHGDALFFLTRVAAY